MNGQVSDSFAFDINDIGNHDEMMDIKEA